MLKFVGNTCAWHRKRIKTLFIQQVNEYFLYNHEKNLSPYEKKNTKNKILIRKFIRIIK